MTSNATRVFLHVGSPKTGTTFLQDVLWTQRDEARAQGLLLPGERFNDHYLATLGVREIADHPGHPVRARRMWERLVAEAAGWPGTVLISHELFAGATRDQAQRAVASLVERGAEVHVVLTARDLLRQIPAEWQEHVKHRSTATFADFVAGVRGDKERSSWFWQVQDFAGVLERWGATLPPERVHVVTVPASGTDPQLLWQRFATLLGLAPERFDTDLPRSNSSLGTEQAELLRRVNAALGERLPMPGPYPRVVKNVLAHRILEPRSGTKIALTDDDAGFAVEESGRIVHRLQTAGWDVVGDLGELQPEVRGGEGAGAPEPGDTVLLEEAVATMADLLVAFGERQYSQQESRQLVETARTKPIRFALVQASHQRPLLRRARRVYDRLRQRYA